MPSKVKTLGAIPGEKGEGEGGTQGRRRRRQERESVGGNRGGKRKRRGKEWKAKKRSVFWLTSCHGHGSGTSYSEPAKLAFTNLSSSHKMNERQREPSREAPGSWEDSSSSPPSTRQEDDIVPERFEHQSHTELALT